MLAIKYLYGTGKVIVPPLTWNSDIVSVIKNDFKPVFVDINLNDLAMNNDEIIKKIDKNTKAVFLTHAQGFNGLTDKLIYELKKENNSYRRRLQSHGAKHKNKKLGTFGFASNFSFYYAHHLSTIEGGMVCTNNKNFMKQLKC